MHPPSPFPTAPAVVAAWTSLGLFILSGAWFAVSTVGYGLIWKFTHPLPKDETMNIERVFDTPPISRWAVNVVISWFTCTFMLIQTFFLVAYRMDRRVKRDFARQVRMGLAVRSAAQGQDSWDGEELDLAEQKRHQEIAERDQYDKENANRYAENRQEPRSAVHVGLSANPGAYSAPPLPERPPNRRDPPGASTRRRLPLNQPKMEPGF